MTSFTTHSEYFLIRTANAHEISAILGLRYGASPCFKLSRIISSILTLINFRYNSGFLKPLLSASRKFKRILAPSFQFFHCICNHLPDWGQKYVRVLFENWARISLYHLLVRMRSHNVKITR
jgi:hypothetical protein